MDEHGYVFEQSQGDHYPDQHPKLLCHKVPYPECGFVYLDTLHYLKRPEMGASVIFGMCGSLQDLCFSFLRSPMFSDVKAINI